MAILFKMKISVIQYFYVQNLFSSLFPQFQECEAKICQLLVNCVIFYIFVTALSPKNNNFGARKNLKKQRYP